MEEIVACPTCGSTDGVSFCLAFGAWICTERGTAFDPESGKVYSYDKP